MASAAHFTSELPGESHAGSTGFWSCSSSWEPFSWASRGGRDEVPLHLLRRILRRPSDLLRRAPDGSIEVIVGELEVALRRHRLAVADPRARDVDRVLLDQFRLPRAAQIPDGVSTHEGTMPLKPPPNWSN